jgi:uncharacterized protein (TIGR03790 family)
VSFARLPETHGARRWLIALAAIAASVSPATGATPQTTAHPEVLVVVNRHSDVSLAIGAYYRARRGIPAANLLELDLPLFDPSLSERRHERISRPGFVEKIRDPIERHLLEHDLVDTIEIIVTTKGVPLQVTGPSPREKGEFLRDFALASVDAELALLFTRLDGSTGVENTVNPYFDAAQDFASFRRERPGLAPRYLVARLTGYQDPVDPGSGVPVDIKHLIDAATGDVPVRTFLIDEDPRDTPGLDAGNLVMLAPAAAALRAQGLPVLHDTTGDFRADVLNIAGYASWGSNATGDAGPPYYGRIGGRLYPGTFANRAIATDLVSFSARTFTGPPKYGQSLSADLVRLGAAGVVGNAFEPTLGGVSRPHILLRRYAQGVRAVEAYFRSVPYLGWMNVYIGDPLMVTAHPVPQEPDDRDGDGVPNTEDNCADQPNAEQLDSNGDGFGNLCDADVDNDGVVTTSWGANPPGDIERIRASAGRFVPDHDLNGDGRVDARDVSIAMLSAFLPPGPSGLAASEVRPRPPQGSRKSTPIRGNSDTLGQAPP